MLADEAKAAKAAAEKAKSEGKMDVFYRQTDLAESKTDELAALVAGKPEEKKAASDASTGDALGDTRRAIQRGTYVSKRFSQTESAKRFRSKLLPSGMPGQDGNMSSAERFRSKLNPSGFGGAGGLKPATEVKSKSEELLAKIEQHMAAQRKVIEAQLGGD